MNQDSPNDDAAAAEEMPLPQDLGVLLLLGIFGLLTLYTAVAANSVSSAKIVASDGELLAG